MGATWEQLRIEDQVGTVRVGPSRDASIARDRMLELRAEGMGLRRIARQLTVEGVPTPSGRGQWWPASVARTIDRDRWNAYMRGYRRRR